MLLQLRSQMDHKAGVIRRRESCGFVRRIRLWFAYAAQALPTAREESRDFGDPREPRA
jgi:hypothetical protein